MKIFFSLSLGVLLLCSGCAVENLDPASVHPAASPSQPGIMDKPSKQQRTAIMSGDKPDWSQGPSPRYPEKKR
ncbi:hypothetical protein [Kalamiella sp. sgz302252]|uniref:hypothetical protein n=1 Tax=Pantoea sp. sgz302252 TaxID=3341827 RepID=UPI0036D2F55D